MEVVAACLDPLALGARVAAYFSNATVDVDTSCRFRLLLRFVTFYRNRNRFSQIGCSHRPVNTRTKGVITLPLSFSTGGISKVGMRERTRHEGGDCRDKKREIVLTRNVPCQTTLGGDQMRCLITALDRLLAECEVKRNKQFGSENPNICCLASFSIKRAIASELSSKSGP